MPQITRRKFLKTGARGIALASIPAIFRFDPMAALASPVAEGMTLEDYYGHFGVNETIIGDIMAAALSRGGDYCDIYFQHRINSYIILEDDVVNRAYTSVDFGVGIRAMKGDQIGFSFTEDISPNAMKLAAKTAANIASGSPGKTPASFTPHPPADYYHVETGWETVGIDRKVPLLKQTSEKIFSLDSRVIKSRGAFEDETSYVLLINSEGRVVYDYQPMTGIFASCVAEQNGQREDNYCDLGVRGDIGFYTTSRLDYLAKEAVSRTTTLFDAVKPEAGEMEVVLAPGSSGILLHEAIGHGMEADFNRKGVSIFADKIDKPVAETFVSIVDDGTNPNMRGSINVDDEGNDSQKTYLVKDGILRSYMHDRISARHYNVAPTGNGRRESFRHAPMPRMRNTYMLPGPHSRDEIIGSVKKGLYAETFTNGEVFIGAGDFSFYVKGGRLIENGKLTKPVKDINIIGNGPEVLKKIVMVADDLGFAEGSWTCGKNGQSIPASQGLPTVKVSSITVGGTG